MITKSDAAIYGGTILISLFGHVGLVEGLGAAARRAPVRRRAVEIALYKPPPPPVVEPPPEAEKPKPKKDLPPPPPPEKVDLTKLPPPVDVPPPPNTSSAQEPAEAAKPVFGISMSSVVGPGSGAGIRVRVGNTLMKAPEADYTPPAEVKPYVKPVALYKVSKQPKKKQDCIADYPPEAKAMGIEGKVTLEVQIGPDGAVTEVEVLEGLGYGLDEAASRALRKCRFSPAEAGGQPVATVIRYTYRFVIED